MDRYEMAERLVEKCGISYEEAGNVLREANYDLLEAMIILERRGRMGGPSTFTTETRTPGRYNDKTAADAESFAELVRITWKKLCSWVRNIMKYQVIVTKNGSETVRFPMAPAVLVFCFTAGLGFTLVLISLLSGYSFTVRKVQ